MPDELSTDLKTIEQDILDLKTSIRRVNNSTAGFYESARLPAGRYIVNYEPSASAIFSFFEAYGAVVCPNTPSDNSQIFYLNAASKVRVTSNRKIISVDSL